MAQIPKVQFTLPGVSIFDIDTTRIGTMPIGKIIPVDYTFMLPGDTARCTVAQLSRMAALIAPAYAGFELTFDSFFIPFRLLNKDTYESFAYGKNPDGVDYEKMDYTTLLSIVRQQNDRTPLIGSLLDYLRYPVFADRFNALIDQNTVYYIVTAAGVPFANIKATYDQWRFIDPANSLPLDEPTQFAYVNLYGNTGLNDFPLAIMTMSLYAYVLAHPDETSVLPNNDPGRKYATWIQTYDTMEKWFASSEFKRLDITTYRFIEDYQNYVFQNYLRAWIEAEDPTDDYSLIPLKAYWRVYADWFVNTNIVDPEQILDDYVFRDYINMLPGNKFVEPANYWWRNDYFTSMLPTAAGDYQVPLPSDGTVQDLAEASALQRFMNRIWAAGKRYYDNVRAIYGWESKDARDQYSKIIGSDTHYMGVSEVTQTSESTETSRLGDLAGKVVDRGYDKYHYKYTADEHGIILTVAYIGTRVGYMDAISPLLKLTNTLDFVIPDMADVGFVPYTLDVLTGNPLQKDTVLGYQRQYYPFIADFDSVHGDMKTTLQYWHLYRRFQVDEQVALNEDFLTMNDTDDLGRIFAIPEERGKVLYMFNFYKEVDRPLSRSIKMII